MRLSLALVLICQLAFGQVNTAEENLRDFYEYLGKNVRYPAEARVKGIQGKLFVLFEVNHDRNKIINQHLLSPLGDEFINMVKDEVFILLIEMPENAVDDLNQSYNKYALPFHYGLEVQYDSDVSIELSDDIQLLSPIYITAFGSQKQQPFTLKKEFSSIQEAVEYDRNFLRLSITGKDMGQIDPAINKLTKLQFLDLQGNAISGVPKELTTLNNLKELYLPQNQIKELPVEFKNLKSLKTLALANNRFTTFPEEILELKKLEALDLSSNEISEIPQNIDNLKKLKLLALLNNNIPKLPESIYNLKKLEKLYLKGNPISQEEIENLKKHMKGVEIIF
ncbi:MAG: leucine-rich repeat domain-containing protein [Candidatus Cyclobacteriaceae bacterium M2_1C_046]